MKVRIFLFIVLLFCLATGNVLAAEIDAANGMEETQPQVKKQMQELQAMLLADPELMAQILLLKDDPEVQSLLDDPDVIRAVAAGDIGALAGNGRVMKLLNKPQVQEIQKRIQP